MRFSSEPTKKTIVGDTLAPPPMWSPHSSCMRHALLLKKITYSQRSLSLILWVSSWTSNSKSWKSLPRTADRLKQERALVELQAFVQDALAELLAFVRNCMLQLKTFSCNLVISILGRHLLFQLLLFDLCKDANFFESLWSLTVEGRKYCLPPAGHRGSSLDIDYVRFQSWIQALDNQ